MKNIFCLNPHESVGRGLAIAACCAALLHTSAHAAISIQATADSFVFTGIGPNSAGYYDAASRNFGAMNSRQVAGAGNSKGEFDSVIRFDTSSAVASLNLQYGAGNWTITGVSLTLCTSDNVAGPGLFNYPGSAGNFIVSWMASDGIWAQGTGYKNNGTGAGNAADHNVTGANFTSGVTWNSLRATLAIYPATLLSACYYQDLGMLQTETFNLGASNSGFINTLRTGGAVSLLLAPGDNSVAFNFTSHNYGAGADPYNPTLTLTIDSTPLVASSDVPLPPWANLTLGVLLCAAAIWAMRNAPESAMARRHPHWLVCR